MVHWTFRFLPANGATLKSPFSVLLSTGAIFNVSEICKGTTVLKDETQREMFVDQVMKCFLYEDTIYSNCCSVIRLHAERPLR